MHGGPASGTARRRVWRLLARSAGGLLLLVVAVLLFRYARAVDWRAVLAVTRGYPTSTLAQAAGLAAASHALYACYDLIGRRQVGHVLPTVQVLATTFVSYAFNLNLGALVGGVALRYRLYSRHGLAIGTITQVLALSVVTNWLGYLVLAGVVFVIFPLPLPPTWAIDSGGLRWVGLLLLAGVAAYLLTCFAGRRRVWRLRGRAFKPPSGPIAVLQVVLSCANWMLIASVMAVLLGGRLEYTIVLNVLLIAALAGVVAHVPAGLGVLEAVFVALLSHRVPQAEMLGALLAYRAVYYLAPLALALGVYLWLDVRAKRSAAESAGAAR
jgi:uncharacterized membrane protein YbhN (UPF0104 family)